MNKKFIYYIMIILTVFILFIGFKFYINYQKINDLKSEITQLKQNIEETQVENEELKKQLQGMNDLDYIEKVARQKLGLVKPGELLLIPVEKENKKDE